MKTNFLTHVSAIIAILDLQSPSWPTCGYFYLLQTALVCYLIKGPCPNKSTNQICICAFRMKLGWILENGFTRTSAWNFSVLFFGGGNRSKISKIITWEACEWLPSCVCVSGHTMRECVWECVGVKSGHSFQPILCAHTHSSHKISMESSMLQSGNGPVSK